ncbi:MAG TPA: hypothetical protein PLA71_00830 [Saccharofermentans sp.]|nr:hypothetical protein [Saccharofermentans sp.]
MKFKTKIDKLLEDKQSDLKQIQAKIDKISKDIGKSKKKLEDNQKALASYTEKIKKENYDLEWNINDLQQQYVELVDEKRELNRG